MARPENWIIPAGASPVRVITGESLVRRRGELAAWGVKSLLGGSKRASRRANRQGSSSLVPFTLGKPAAHVKAQATSIPVVTQVGSFRGIGSCACARDGSGSERPDLP
uniref:hypothetical protein n=1 Tax=Ferrimicrobium acidiphilum TaxID=121039 RepID=UPI0023F13508